MIHMLYEDANALLIFYIIKQSTKLIITDIPLKWTPKAIKTSGSSKEWERH